MESGLCNIWSRSEIGRTSCVTSKALIRPSVSVLASYIVHSEVHSRASTYGLSLYRHVQVPVPAVRSPRLTYFCSSSSEKCHDYERILRAWTRANGRWTTDVHNSIRTFTFVWQCGLILAARSVSDPLNVIHKLRAWRSHLSWGPATCHILVAHLQSQPVPLLIRTSWCTAFSAFGRACYVVSFVLEISFQ